ASVNSTFLMPALAHPSSILRYPALREVVWWMDSDIFPPAATAGITCVRGAARGARSTFLRESMCITIAPFAARLQRMRSFGDAPESDVVIVIAGLETPAVGHADQVRIIPPTTAAKGFVLRQTRPSRVDGFLRELHRVPGVGPLDNVSKHVIQPERVGLF